MNNVTMRTTGTSDTTHKVGDLSNNSHSVKASVGNLTTAPSNSGKSAQAQMPPRDPKHHAQRNRPFTSGATTSSQLPIRSDQMNKKSQRAMHENVKSPTEAKIVVIKPVNSNASQKSLNFNGLKSN